jgi:ribonuclease HI
MKLIISSDGCSRDNPGPAAIGAVLSDVNGNVVDTISRAIGKATNNEAEYKAAIAAMYRARMLGATFIELRSDSTLLVNQLNGRFKVKAPGLIPLHVQAMLMLTWFEQVDVRYVPREQNAEADRLANSALRRARSH